MKKTDKVQFKPKSIILLLGTFASGFYDFSSDQRPATSVCVLESRPDFESSRATCRELLKRKITPTVIADNSAGFLFHRNLVKEVWIAYETADANGALCDIGALILGVLAKRHKVPVNLSPAKKRRRFIGMPSEICYLNGARTAPAGAKSYVPLMEFLPKKYVRKIYA